MLFKKKQIELTEEQKEEVRIKDFFDCILPSTIKFSTDHYIIGDSYRCVWVIKEYTKPLFSIPTHQFLFNAGNIEPKVYIDTMQLEPSEFDLIKYPERGTCLYRCGNERYLLQVIAPDFKQKMFGKAGGR